MNLDEGQRAKVSHWISEGLKISEIQNRLVTELGVRLTYMEVRLLVDDLKLTPIDPEVAPVPVMPEPAKQASPEPSPSGTPGESTAPGGVSVKVDQLAKPGALVSGKVTFSDGNSAEWYMDQAGRLGLVPGKPGYRPPASDVQQFQMALESELAKMGF